MRKRRPMASSLIGSRVTRFPGVRRSFSIVLRHSCSNRPVGLAFPGRLVNHRPAVNNDFFFTKVFGDGEYIAAGQLRIPPNKHKPSKMTKDNTYVRSTVLRFVTKLISGLPTGVLRDRGCRHVQGARIVVCPLHGRHDLGAARKHVLHREHLGTRREVVLRSSAARFCGRRGSAGSASRSGSRAHDDPSATSTAIEQSRSGTRDRPPFERASATRETCRVDKVMKDRIFFFCGPVVFLVITCEMSICFFFFVFLWKRSTTASHALPPIVSMSHDFVTP
jgi:hypothetical protein